MDITFRLAGTVVKIAPYRQDGSCAPDSDNILVHSIITHQLPQPERFVRDLVTTSSATAISSEGFDVGEPLARSSQVDARLASTTPPKDFHAVSGKVGHPKIPSVHF